MIGISSIVSVIVFVMVLCMFSWVVIGVCDFVMNVWVVKMVIMLIGIFIRNIVC